MTALYRHFSQTGKLLYVGISLCALQRTIQHKMFAGWFDMVSRIEIQHFSDILLALEAEKIAIKSEKPEYNKTHKNHQLTKCEIEKILQSDLGLPYISITIAKDRPYYYYRRGKIRIKLPDPLSKDFISIYSNEHEKFENSNAHDLVEAADRVAGVGRRLTDGKL